MPSLLLDTGPFAMIIQDNPRLGEGVRQKILEADSVFVPSIAFYEIGQKVRIGKWPEMAPHIDILEARTRDGGLQVLPLTERLALSAALLDWDHRDPFDRMIAAVALQERMPLVSSDAVFEAVGVERVWG